MSKIDALLARLNKLIEKIDRPDQAQGSLVVQYDPNTGKTLPEYREREEGAKVRLPYKGDAL